METKSIKCSKKEGPKSIKLLPFNKTKKQEKIKLKPSCRKEIINITVEINEIEKRKAKEKVNETKSFEKTNKINMSLRLKRRKKTEINSIQNERGVITMDPADIKRIIREHSKKLYTIQMKWNNSLETTNQENSPKMKQTTAQPYNYLKN